MPAAAKTPSLPPEWAAAIREDALSYIGRVAVPGAGLDGKISGVHRVLIRVGRWYPGNPRSWLHGGDRIIEHLKSAPYCQACGHRIPHGTHAITYRVHRRRGYGLGRQLYIHEDCPEEASSVHEGSNRGRRARGTRRANQGGNDQQLARGTQRHE